MKVSFLILSLLFFSCNSTVKHESNTVTNEDTTKKINRIKQSNLDTNKLKGLWVSISYINDLNKYHSIVEAEKNTKFLVSVFIRDTFIEALEYYQQAPWIGLISKSNIKLEERHYSYSVSKNNELFINDVLNSYGFKKINYANATGSNDGRDYLYSYIFLGDYKFIDSYSNKTYAIAFCDNNELKGFMNYRNFYPSSYLGNDILLIKDKKGHATLSFIFKYCESGFILEEVKNFDWNDEPLVKTGRIFKLEKQ